MKTAVFYNDRSYFTFSVEDNFATMLIQDSYNLTQSMLSVNINDSGNIIFSSGDIFANGYVAKDAILSVLYEERNIMSHVRTLNNVTINYVLEKLYALQNQEFAEDFYEF